MYYLNSNHASIEPVCLFSCTFFHSLIVAIDGFRRLSDRNKFETETEIRNDWTGSGVPDWPESFCKSPMLKLLPTDQSKFIPQPAGGFEELRKSLSRRPEINEAFGRAHLAAEAHRFAVAQLGRR